MKILYHHRTASRDGQAVHIEEMVAALREQGHEVRVVGPQASGDGMGAKVDWVHRLRNRLPKAVYEVLELGYSAVAYLRLARAAREFRPAVVYERYNLFLLAGVLLKQRLGIPLLLEVNSPLADEREAFGGLGWPALARWAERFVWLRADAVLPVTQVLATIITHQSGVPAERMMVVPNGINEAHFAAAPSPEQAKSALGLEGALVLGFTGFVRDWHGVDRVVRWLASDQSPKRARLLVVGDGPARPSVERLAQELGVGNRVLFTGIVPRERVPALVAAFDIALQPAVTPYASPLKLPEYMALGKAVLAPRVPNLMEVLSDGENGLLFDADDPEALTQALTRLSSDAALRASLANGAAASIGRLGLTWQANARRVAARAEALVGVPPPPCAGLSGAIVP